jgi:putative ABC transport system permease protein
VIPVARRLLLRNRGALTVTVAGVAVTVALLLFLIGVHDGVKDGSTRYVRTAGVDIWVSGRNSDNILKSSSFLPSATAERIAAIEGVAVASPLLRVITKGETAGRRTSTLFILAFDPVTKLGAPRTMGEGTADLAPREIVLDHSFVAKSGLKLGSALDIQGTRFRVAGISEGTNPLVSQFGFTRIDDAAELLGLRSTASFIVVKIESGADRGRVAGRIRAQFPGLAVYEAPDFTRSHEEEMESGVLPVFAAAAVFAAVVCAFIVALMLYNAVLERREDYATLKALGAGQRYLLGLVIAQALLVTAAGCLGGAALIAIVTPVLLRAVPVLAIQFTPSMLLVLPLALVVGALAAAVPIQLLRRIYPGEVFRA